MLLADLRVWLIDSVPRRPASAVVWLDRGGTRLQVRVPTTANSPCGRRCWESACRDRDWDRSAQVLADRCRGRCHLHRTRAAPARGQRRHVQPTDDLGQQVATAPVRGAAARSTTWWTPVLNYPTLEGAFGLGRGIAQRLAAAGEHVVDVPPTLSMRAPLLSTGGGRKTDPADARSVAQVALHHPSLRQITPEDQTVVPRLLSEHRDDLAHEHARVLNRLHQLLRELIPGGAAIGLSTTKAAALPRGVRPTTITDACRRDLARELLADLRRIDQRIKTNQAQITTAVAVAGSSLPDLHGVAVVLTAKLLDQIGDVRHFPTAHHFTSYTGTAPVDASSGNRVRHRLSTGGNRQLNAVLHAVAVCQGRDPGPGRVHYQRKIAEGKTPSEARRALKRRLANVIYRQITKDQRAASQLVT
jgi:transposase